MSALPAISAAWLERLQVHGYRLTAPRRAVVETIAGSAHVLSPQDVYERARRSCPGLGLVTVYRTVDKLEELGLIQRVHRPTGCQAFVAAADGHQHLLVCQQCGRAQYFSGDLLDGLMGEVAGQTGYQIREHWLQLFGLCSECSDVPLVQGAQR